MHLKLLFLICKVLVDFDMESWPENSLPGDLSQRIEVQKFIDHSPLLFRYETGLISKEEFFEAVREGTGFSGAWRSSVKFLPDIFEPIPVMVELHSALRKNGIPTFIFSNTNELE